MGSVASWRMGIATFKPEVRKPAWPNTFFTLNLLIDKHWLKDEVHKHVPEIELKRNMKNRKGGKKWKFKSREGASTLADRGSYCWLIRGFQVDIEEWEVEEASFLGRQGISGKIQVSWHALHYYFPHSPEKADVTCFPLEMWWVRSEQWKVVPF